MIELNEKRTLLALGGIALVGFLVKITIKLVSKIKNELN